MNQGGYARNIETFPSFLGFVSFRSLIHRPAWLSHIRPDIMAPVNILSPTTVRTLESKQVNFINWKVRRVKANEYRWIPPHKLWLKVVKMVVFTDSSIANNAYSRVQLGFIILLTNGTVRANILHFSSHK